MNCKTGQKAPQRKLKTKKIKMGSTCLQPLRSRFSSSGRFDTNDPIAESVICNSSQAK